MRESDVIGIIILSIASLSFCVYPILYESAAATRWRNRKKEKMIPRPKPNITPPPPQMSVYFTAYRRPRSAALNLCAPHTARLSKIGRITVVVDPKQCEICNLK